jgi:hypothetical protein
VPQLPKGVQRLPAEFQRVGGEEKPEESKVSVWVIGTVAAVAALGLVLTVRRRMKQTQK